MAHKPPEPAGSSTTSRPSPQRTGQTFTWPQISSAAASRGDRAAEGHAPVSTGRERAIERIDDRAARSRRPRTPSTIHGFEVVGYGSNATWSQRS